MSFGNAQRHPDKKLTQAQAEAQMVQFLCGVRPSMRESITVDTLLRRYTVPAKVAEYRLILAQQRWAAEQA
jgi:hypothetical protein